MTDPTPLYRNLVLERAVSEGCPAEVTKEAIEMVTRQHNVPDLTTIEIEAVTTAAAYAYTAGRVARWDALVKGSPRLLDAIMAQVHEFFHDEPFGQHDGSAHDCTDCSTVSALAADAAAAFYHAIPQNPDVYVESEEPEDEVPGEYEYDLAEPQHNVLVTEENTAALDTMTQQIPVVTVDTVLGPLPSTTDKFRDGVWRAA